MKVLLVDQISNINWKYSFSLANSLTKNGVDVEVATDVISNNNYCKCRTIPLFNTDVPGVSRIAKLKNYLSSYKRIIKYLKVNDVSILHIEWLTFSPIDFYFLRRISKFCKVVLTIHDIVAFDSHYYDKKYYPKIYNLVDAIILQTEDNVKRFKNMFPTICKSKIFLAYHGNYLDFADIHPKDESRKRLGIPDNSFVYLFFGQIKKIKGLDLLVNAFIKLANEHSNVYLVIAGNVWHNSFDYCQMLIDKSKVSNQIKEDIKFIPDDQVGYYFSASDVVCLPYTEIYQSGVVQLSYAYKKPAIVSNLPGFLMVVRDSVNGFVFENLNSNSLEEKMDLAFRSSDNLGKMGRLGYEEIKTKYSWDKISSQISRIYQNVEKK